MAEDKIPKAWEWYCEALKWLIAIAAALLAVVLQQASIDHLTRLQWAGYCASASALLISAAAGLYGYLQLLGASNRKEIERPTEEQSKAAERYLRRTGKGYQICIG